MARATKKVATKKAGSQDSTMYAVSYRKYLTWKAFAVFETQAKAVAFANESEQREGIAHKVEPVKYMG